MKKYIFTVSAMLVALPVFAYDIGSIQTSVGSVQVNSDGSVSVDSVKDLNINNTNVTGSNIKVDSSGNVSADSLNVKTNSGQVGASISQPVNISNTGVITSPTGQPVNVTITTPDSEAKTIQAQFTSDGISATIDGRSVSVSARNGSLGVQSGSLSSEQKQLVVGLPGNTVTLIKNNDDLKAYANIVVSTRPGVKNVSVTDNGLVVTYEQPAKFFGIFRSSLNAKAVVATGGKVEVDLPWYSFLYSKNTGAVKTSIQSSAGSNLTVSKSDDAVSVQNNAKAINVVSGSISNSINLSNGTKSGSIQNTTTSGGSNTTIKGSSGKTLELNKGVGGTSVTGN